MTDPQLAGRALSDWLREAENQGRIAPGAVRRDQIMWLAHNSARLSVEDIAASAPDLAQWAPEVAQVLAGSQGPQAAGQPPVSPSAGEQDAQFSAPQAQTARPGVHTSAPDQQPVAPPRMDQTVQEGVSVEVGGLPGDLQLAGYDGGIPGVARHRVNVDSSDGGLAYSWPSRYADGQHVIYRVVFNEGTRPLGPEDGLPLGVTRLNRVEDPYPIQGPRRMVQVWTHTGADLGSAARMQPELWAETTVVSPVRQAQARWDHGAMALSWTTPPGVERVRVYRIPAERHGTLHPGELDNFLVAADSPNLFGLSDLHVQRGAAYVYRMVSWAGGESSPSVDVTAEVPYEARPVVDLKAEVVIQPQGPRSGLVALQWTQAPEARVVIYRSEHPPQAGLTHGIIPLAALHENGLRDRVPYTAEPVDQNTRRMSQVPWPAGWTNAYFVPVTLTGTGDECLPGQAVRVTGVPAPGRPSLAQRGDLQVISFSWPEAAGTVRVHTAATGADPAQVIKGTPTLEMDKERYVKHGGIRLDLQATQNTDVILTAWVSGDNHSDPVVVSVPARPEVRYSLTTQRRMGIGPVKYGRLVLWNEQGLRQTWPFVAVHNPKRLPLHAKDGEHLEIVPDDTPDAGPQRAVKPPSLSGGAEGAAYRVIAPRPATGYVRIFLAPDVNREIRQRVLILDPPVGSLTWK